MLKNKLISTSLVLMVIPTFSFAADGNLLTLPNIILIVIGIVALAILVDWLFGTNTNQSKKNNGLKGLFGKTQLPDFIDEDNASYHNIKKGFDIILEGEVKNTLLKRDINLFSVQPTNYRGIRPIPKLLVNEGDVVKAGDQLFYDKDHPDIFYVSPVSGTVKEIRRGNKRAITDIIVEHNGDMQYKNLEALDLENATQEQVIDFLKDNGGIPLFTQRPFGVVPNLESLPSRIFISGFDSFPLAVSYKDIIDEGDQSALQKGIDALNKITPHEVHLGLNTEEGTSNPLSRLTGVNKHWFSGPHPAGNVGVQIHNVNPMKLNEVVWTIDPQSLVILGKIFSLGVYDAKKTYAIVGDTEDRGFVKSYLGASIIQLLDGDKYIGKRKVSGSILSGEAKSSDEFINAKDTVLTLVEEGDDYELFGWLLPLKPRPTVSRTFPNFLFPDMQLSANTNTHGEKRAFVMTGQYEDVLPIDTYPQHLFKAIITNNFERMQGLGIHELLEEDVALCEFVCTSKQPLQKILREGLNYMSTQV